jgi:alkanesulfonate monooxygenase SsuD/methylene tetrahydromethanopterin reductase-like flavin-dependent oxidoreductase (luciferase family)
VTGGRRAARPSRRSIDARLWGAVIGNGKVIDIMAEITFGLTLPQRGVFFGVTTIAEMLDMARDADRSDLFDSVWVGDSLLAKPRPEALTLLGALASATERVRLGTGCMASLPVRDPFVFAYQWATLDMIAQGRMLLAACTGIVGGGASAREGAIWGVADAERASRMEENIEICRRLWTGERVSFEGKYTRYDGVALDSTPVQQPCPIWIAANPFRPPYVERAMQRVADIADGWMTANVGFGLFDMLYAKLREALRRAGKDADTFPNMLYHNININPDRQAGLEESKKFLDAYYGPVFTPEMVDAWTVSGSPAECVDQIRALRDKGGQSITFRITSWDQRGQYERMAGEVLPEVNRA